MQNDHTTYIIVAAYGKLGTVYSETDIDKADYETTIDRLRRCEIDEPIKVIAFNEIEGWCRDVSRNIAEALANIFAYRAQDIPSPVLEFCRRYDFDLP